ncbi:MAG: hypothetical protein ACI91T_003223 [Natronomonas sp.]|jgi:hypothetical protein
MPEPFVMRQRIEPNWTERLKERLSELLERASSDEEQVREVWVEEGLHTMSLFVEHATDGEYLVWYVEADDVDRLIEARMDSTHPLHDLEDDLMAAVLEDPNDTGDVEPLFHGVNPNRPQEFVAKSMK